MKLYLKGLLLLAFLTLAGTSSFASHVAGGDFSYECIGPNQYRVTLKLFKDCAGIALGNTISITVSQSCTGTSQALTLTLQDPNTGTNCTAPDPATCAVEISQLCPGDQLNSTCHAGGTFPGMLMYKYSAVVTLPSLCDSWTFGYTLSARNCSSNLQICTGIGQTSGQDFHTEAQLFSATAPCNNSPIFTSQPIPYVCANQLVNYNFGVIEPDGDSLVYSLVSAQTALNTNALYTAPYTPTDPLPSSLPGTTLNPQTGQLQFIPTSLGNWVFAVKVAEYNRITHQIKGSTIRDIQFVVQSCSNNVPNANAGAITALTGNATQTGPYSIEMCEGQQFCFTASYNDIDAGDTLALLSNMQLVIPGATMTTSGANPIVATICWTAPAGSAMSNNNFSVVVHDDACPVVGMSTFIYNVFVSASTLANADDTICGSMVANLHASGGSVFSWASISGDPIAVGTNFTCNPCQDPIATPSQTTTYVVTSDLTATCFNQDTVTIFVTNTFDHTISQASDTVCLSQGVQMEVTPIGNGVFTYLWTPNNNLNDSTISNPIANFSTAGVFQYYVTLTNELGCSLTDSINIFVGPNFPPPAIASVAPGNPLFFCTGDSTQLDITWGPGIPPPGCAISTVQCGASLDNHSVGIVNTSNTVRGLFPGTKLDGRVQMLYTSADLQAAGFSAGKIAEIGFTVANKLSTDPFNGLTIKMGCSPFSTLAASFQGGMSTVFGPVDYSTTPGLNLFHLDVPYVWDGTQNLIIEVCYHNTAASLGGDDILSLSQVGYACSAGDVANTGALEGCSLTNATTQNRRPQLTLNTCNYPVDTSVLTYNWSDGTHVSDSTIANPYTHDLADYVHTLTVVNILNGCTTIDTIAIGVSNPLTNCGPDVGICAGDTMTLMNPTAVNAFQVLWTPSTYLSSATVLHPFIAALGATTTYTLTVTDIAGCTASDVMTVNYNPLPIASFAGLDTIYCQTNPLVTLTPSPSIGDGVTQPFGVFTGAGIESDSLFNPLTIIGGYTNVTYTYTDINGCMDDTIMTTHIVPVGNSSIQGFDIYYCIDGGLDTLHGLPAGGTFVGVGMTDSIFNPATAGLGPHTITYHYTDPLTNCPHMPIVLTDSVVALPIVNITNVPNNANYCHSSAAVTLIGTPAGGSFSIDGVAGASLLPASLSNGQHTIQYCFSMPNAPFCSNCTQITFTINDYPTVSAGIDDSICAGSCFTLNATGAATYVWNPATGLNTVTGSNPIACPQTTTTYSVTGTSSAGCSSTDVFVLTILPNPVVNISATPFLGTVPLDVNFTDSAAANTSYYAWNFADGGTSSDEAPKYTFETAGVFEVILTATNFNHQCSTQDSVLIVVNDSVQIHTFNIFTPDGDGHNDLFQVKTEGMAELDVDIYNRWGTKVGEYHGVDNGWDGRNKSGQLVDDGVYFYIAKGIGHNGKTYTVQTNPELKGFLHMASSK